MLSRAISNDTSSEKCEDIAERRQCIICHTHPKHGNVHHIISYTRSTEKFGPSWAISTQIVVLPVLREFTEFRIFEVVDYAFRKIKMMKHLLRRLANILKSHC